MASGLTNLTYLHLEDNGISDISAVSGLTNLTGLDLGGNGISDISAVSGLTNLTYLYLGDNSISDISALSGLTQLKVLYLRGIRIWREGIRESKGRCTTYVYTYKYHNHCNNPTTVYRGRMYSSNYRNNSDNTSKNHRVLNLKHNQERRLHKIA